MNIIKRHKSLAIICSLTLILIIIMFAIFSKMIFSNGDSEYGQRLNGIVKINKSTLKTIEESLKTSENVEDAEIRIQGKIIYTTIEFKAGTNLDKAKELATNTLKEYEDNIQQDYDFGYLLKENVIDKEETDEVETGFVAAGTKHPSNDKISWTKK